MMELDTIFCGDALDVLRTLPDNFVHCCITSPPYYALRDYGVDGQIGREDTPAQYVARLTEVFSEVRRVLRPNGTLWLNIADTYCGTGSKGDHLDPKNPSGRNGQGVSLAQRVENVKAKDMIGIPWMLAFALRDTGWYLRSDIIWQKANPMPESCKDRPSRCYEHVFLLTKSRSYYYDALAIAEPMAPSSIARYKRGRIGGKYAEEIPGQNKVQGLNQTRSGGYEKKLCTYPRTDARYLTDDMQSSVASYVAVAAELCETPQPEAIHAEQVCNSKKVSDHHALLPTASATKAAFLDLPLGEREVLRLVAKQLLCAVSDAHRYSETTVTLSCGGQEFTAKGKTVLQIGWKQYSGGETVETPLPELTDGSALPVDAASVKEGKTTPPKHYTEAICCERGIRNRP